MALELGIEQAIQERWAATGALTALVPAARVFTGAAADRPATPYVVWQRLSTTPQTRTSSGREVDRSRVRCEIRTEQLPAAKQIAQAVFDTYNRATLTPASGSCLNMQHAAYEELLLPEGWWRVTAEFDVLHEGAA